MLQLPDISIICAGE